MTDTREPEPYHPPQAYEPPAGPGKTGKAGAAGKAEAGGAAGKSGKAAKTASSEAAQSADVKAAEAGKAAAVADDTKSAEETGGKPAAKPVVKGAAKAAPAADPRNAVKAPPRIPGQDNGPKSAAGSLKKGAAGKGSAAPQAASQEPRQGGGAAAAVPRPAARQEPVLNGGASGAAPAPAGRPAPRTRTARLRVAKADPWSVMKVSFLLSIALGICTIVAAAVLWSVMDAMGVFSTVGGTISDATTSSDGGGFDLQSFLSLPRVLLFTSVIAVINVVLATALATLGAFVYNLSAGFVGGVELTLAEDE
ncbi:DUF3566 domain-containing protein [Streptomyces sp. NPDC008001]|uniref:DUF3566 domain-containing protein n=1 Tax=Streptomyces sp. NPDC008001 TaxID=3364804 RepID=UPI0036EC2385